MDTRTRRQKLEAMASQADASPNEAMIARRLLDALPAPKTLSRDEILAAPSERASVGSRRVWDPNFVAYVVVDVDDPLFSHLLHEEDADPDDPDWND